jgi:hypothetical protein
MKKYIEPIVVTCIIAAAAIANFYHVLYYAFHRTPNTIFVGISHYYQDYFYYLSQVTQGEQGAWMSRNLYTTEDIPASPLWFTNIAIGKIGGLLGLKPWTAYDLSIFIASIVSLWLLYRTARILFPKNPTLRVSAFAVSVFTTCYYLVQKNPDGTSFINPYQYFYNYTESLNRLGGVTHLILQNILSLAAIITFSRILDIAGDKAKGIRKIVKTGAVFSVFLTLLMFINPIYVLVDVIVCFLGAIVYFIKTPSIKTLGKFLLVAVVTGIPLTLPTIGVLQTFSVPFYQYFRWWESSIYPTNIIIFLYSTGPIAILAALGLIPYFRRGGALRLLGFFFVIIPIALYFSPIPTYFSFPRFRLTQPPAYIFLGAMAVEALLLPDALISFLRKKKNSYILYFVLLTTYLLFQLPMIRHEILARKNDITLISWVNHLEKPLYEGLMVLSKAPKDKVAIGFNNLELLIPVVTGLTVYTGHHSLSYNYPEKIADVSNFYNSIMTYDEANEFLQKGNIGYILWRKRDNPNPEFPKSYPFLKKFFENQVLVIYTYSP